MNIKNKKNLCSKKNIYNFFQKNLKTALFLCSFFISFSVHAFNDVSDSDLNIHMFSHLQDVGIMRADAQNNFNPTRGITRAEALTVAMRAGNIKIAGTFDGNTYFGDVNPNTWYAPVVARAVNVGIIKPNYAAFRPTQVVTKAEFLAFLFRSTRVQVNLFKPVRNVAKDIPNDSWMKPYFAHAKKYQIAYLPPDNLYRPAKKLSRREVAVMTYRQLKLFHGSRSTSRLMELQAEIQQFLELVKNGQAEEAETHMHKILKINEKLMRTKNSEDAVATLALSRSMEHFTESLRYFRYGKNLKAIENLHLSIKQAKKAEAKSITIAPFAKDLSEMIGETLMAFAEPDYKKVVFNSKIEE